jgi:hypothetical protein
MHDSDRYGTLGWTLKEIAQALGCPMALLKELVTKGVLKGCDVGECEPMTYTPRSGRMDGCPVTLLATQPGPIWYSSRMLRDEYVRQNPGAFSRFGGGVTAHEWAGLRKAVFNRDGWTCTYCGQTDDRLECDHIVPLALGGETTLANLTAACRTCNQRKGAKPLGQWLR